MVQQRSTSRKSHPKRRRNSSFPLLPRDNGGGLAFSLGPLSRLFFRLLSRGESLRCDGADWGCPPASRVYRHARRVSSTHHQASFGVGIPKAQGPRLKPPESRLCFHGPEGPCSLRITATNRTNYCRRQKRGTILTASAIGGSGNRSLSGKSTWMTDSG